MKILFDKGGLWNGPRILFKFYKEKNNLKYSYQYSIGIHHSWYFQSYSGWMSFHLIGWYFNANYKKITILNIDFCLDTNVESIPHSQTDKLLKKRLTLNKS